MLHHHFGYLLAVWVVLAHLLVVLSALHTINVIDDHLLLRIHHFLGVHRLLRWVLSLLKMHFLVL